MDSTTKARRASSPYAAGSTGLDKRRRYTQMNADDHDRAGSRGGRRPRGRRGGGAGWAPPWVDAALEGPAGAMGARGPFTPGGAPFGPAARFGPFGTAGPFGPAGPAGRRRAGRARRGEVRTAIVCLLADGPLNGYQIIQELEQRTQGRWRPSPGAVYPALSQLEDEGVIEAVDSDGRKAFGLTESGRAEADRHADRPKPWEGNDDDETPPDDGRMAMWGTLTQVGAAAQAVIAAGDDDHVRAASEILAQTRRSLYRLLAEDGDDAPEGTPEA